MLPSDPEMLFSYVNLQLRDKYSSLDDMCDILDEDKQSVLNKLDAAGYKYDENQNKFVAKTFARPVGD